MKNEKTFRPDRIFSYFRVEWLPLAFVTLSGLIYNIGLLATPWFEGRLAQCLADILGGNAAASAMARWISFSERFVLPVMVMFCSRPVPRSLAETFTTPLTSISKVTSIWGLDEKLARMPFNLNLPRLLLSRAKCRSPCRTLISTLVCMG